MSSTSTTSSSYAVLEPYLTQRVDARWSAWLHMVVYKMEMHTHGLTFMFAVEDDAYKRFIPRPMCTMMLRERLRSSSYKMVGEFHADMCQIFVNARAYNGPNGPFAKISPAGARDLLAECTAFERHYQFILKSDLTPVALPTRMPATRIAALNLLDRLMSLESIVSEGFWYDSPLDLFTTESDKRRYARAIPTPISLYLLRAPLVDGVYDSAPSLMFLHVHAMLQHSRIFNSAPKDRRDFLARDVAIVDELARALNGTLLNALDCPGRSLNVPKCLDLLQPLLKSNSLCVVDILDGRAAKEFKIDDPRTTLPVRFVHDLRDKIILRLFASEADLYKAMYKFLECPALSNLKSAKDDELVKSTAAKIRQLLEGATASGAAAPASVKEQPVASKSSAPAGASAPSAAPAADSSSSSSSPSSSSSSSTATPAAQRSNTVKLRIAAPSSSPSPTSTSSSSSSSSSTSTLPPSRDESRAVAPPATAAPPLLDGFTITSTSIRIRRTLIGFVSRKSSSTAAPRAKESTPASSRSIHTVAPPSTAPTSNPTPTTVAASAAASAAAPAPAEAPAPPPPMARAASIVGDDIDIDIMTIDEPAPPSDLANLSVAPSAPTSVASASSATSTATESAATVAAAASAATPTTTAATTTSATTPAPDTISSPVPLARGQSTATALRIRIKGMDKTAVATVDTPGASTTSASTPSASTPSASTPSASTLSASGAVATGTSTAPSPIASEASRGADTAASAKPRAIDAEKQAREAEKMRAAERKLREQQERARKEAEYLARKQKALKGVRAERIQYRPPSSDARSAIIARAMSSFDAMQAMLLPASARMPSSSAAMVAVVAAPAAPSPAAAAAAAPAPALASTPPNAAHPMTSASTATPASASSLTSKDQQHVAQSQSTPSAPSLTSSSTARSDARGDSRDSSLVVDGAEHGVPNGTSSSASAPAAAAAAVARSDGAGAVHAQLTDETRDLASTAPRTAPSDASAPLRRRWTAADTSNMLRSLPAAKRARTVADVTLSDVFALHPHACEMVECLTVPHRQIVRARAPVHPLERALLLAGFTRASRGCYWRVHVEVLPATDLVPLPLEHFVVEATCIDSTSGGGGGEDEDGGDAFGRSSSSSSSSWFAPLPPTYSTQSVRLRLSSAPGLSCAESTSSGDEWLAHDGARRAAIAESAAGSFRSIAVSSATSMIAPVPQLPTAPLSVHAADAARRATIEWRSAMDAHLYPSKQFGVLDAGDVCAFQELPRRLAQLAMFEAAMVHASANLFLREPLAAHDSLALRRASESRVYARVQRAARRMRLVANGVHVWHERVAGGDEDDGDGDEDNDDDDDDDRDGDGDGDVAEHVIDRSVARGGHLRLRVRLPAAEEGGAAAHASAHATLFVPTVRLHAIAVCGTLTVRADDLVWRDVDPHARSDSLRRLAAHREWWSASSAKESSASALSELTNMVDA